ncbi:hypothetical protein EYF80_052543 [Liparis tanakae]|uniref:Uncharacterized protein n=1 Tax=Liparis tanakae TaxID=230148 RepID=A0A4Z2FAA5_9TELE|nr:hypothetical protein EYF80_052543 [Liparis tanakae]
MDGIPKMIGGKVEEIVGDAINKAIGKEDKGAEEGKEGGPKNDDKKKEEGGIDFGNLAGNAVSGFSKMF